MLTVDGILTPVANVHPKNEYWPISVTLYFLFSIVTKGRISISPLKPFTTAFGPDATSIPVIASPFALIEYLMFPIQVIYICFLFTYLYQHELELSITCFVVWRNQIEHPIFVVIFANTLNYSIIACLDNLPELLIRVIEVVLSNTTQELLFILFKHSSYKINKDHENVNE